MHERPTQNYSFVVPEYSLTQQIAIFQSDADWLQLEEHVLNNSNVVK
jgi:hypothetical protein